MTIEELNSMAADLTIKTANLNAAIKAAREAGIRADVTLVFTGPPSAGRVQPQAEVSVDAVLPLPLS